MAVAPTENDGSKGGEDHELLGCCRRKCVAPVEERTRGRKGLTGKNELEVAGVQEPGSSLAAPLLIIRRSSGGTPKKEGRRREVWSGLDLSHGNRTAAAIRVS